ncbi:MAG: chromate transporter [Hydrogenibacillus sp.]|nr:chromate transporter [Hydrogenibacillus sp.]
MAEDDLRAERKAAESRLRHIGRRRTALALFWTFFKLSPVTFGGGFAVVPMLERELVERGRLIRREEIVDLFTVAQTVPGSIYVNAGTFIGYRLAGVLGAVMATAGALLPTFLIMVVLAVLYDGLNMNPYVEAAMSGLRPAIVALIAYAGVRVAKTAIVGPLTAVVVVVAFGMLYFLHIHPVILILAGGAIGVLLGFAHRGGRLERDHHRR